MKQQHRKKDNLALLPIINISALSKCFTAYSNTGDIVNSALLPPGIRVIVTWKDEPEIQFLSRM